jgi:hypothetical protein
MDAPTRRYTVGEGYNHKEQYLILKGTVQQKLTGVKSGINQKLMISSIPARLLLFFLNKGTCPFKLKKHF